MFWVTSSVSVNQHGKSWKIMGNQLSSVVTVPQLVINQPSSVSYIFPYGGFHSHGGTQARWLVFVRENPNLKRMMTGGTPMT